MFRCRCHLCFPFQSHRNRPRALPRLSPRPPGPLSRPHLRQQSRQAAPLISHRMRPRLSLPAPRPPQLFPRSHQLPTRQSNRRPSRRGRPHQSLRDRHLLFLRLSTLQQCQRLFLRLFHRLPGRAQSPRTRRRAILLIAPQSSPRLLHPRHGPRPRPRMIQPAFLRLLLH